MLTGRITTFQPSTLQIRQFPSAPCCCCSMRGSKPAKITGMRIILANPRGFCAGVDRAIEIVERALQMFGTPIYVRHEVVHNHHVVARLRELGAVFVEELVEVPDGATVVFSAHGVSTAVENEAARRALQVFDATCPLV